jgi:hypothetical protein
VLEVVMHGAVLAKFPWKAVPLATGPQAKDDAIEDPPAIHPPMPFELGRIMFVQNLLSAATFPCYVTGS